MTTNNKKDSLAQSIGSGAGELALTFLDKLKKKDNNSLITNLANNIQKNLLNTSNSNSSKSIFLSKLLENDSKQESSGTTQTKPKSILIYDDNDLDDSNINVTKIQTSQSEFSLSETNNSIGDKSPKQIVPSMSLDNSLNKTLSSETDQTSKLVDLIDQSLNIEINNSINDTSLSESEAQKKRILIKKRSIELSLETARESKSTPTTSASVSLVETIQEQQLETSPEQIPILNKSQKSNINKNSNSNMLYISLILVPVLSFLVLKIPFILVTYILGLINGVLLSYLIYWLGSKYDLFKYFKKDKKIDLENSRNLLIQSAAKKENKNFDGVYKGWMNELKEAYSPENHFLNKTRSVYLNLDGTMLRLQTTPIRVPKRAVPGEQIGSVLLTEQRIYDLTDCDVSILPKNLCRKRYWSKKYPISLKNVKLLSNKSSEDLILFARTDREKEEWFNLFKKSANKKLIDSLNYIKLNRLNSDTKQTIVKQTSVVSSQEADEKSNSIETQTEQGLLYDSSLNFMNTFIIRIFADFFYHKYWINQIQTKIQNKLNKIKIPYFMEELKITGIDLGSVVPLIKNVSETWYDDKGLWVNLDIDYNGSVQMSLATKLNLMKFKSSSSSLSSSASSSSSPVQSSKSDSKEELNSYIENTFNHKNKPLTEVKKRKKNLAIEDSAEEDSPESSGDEYVHVGMNDDENKLIETANPSKKLLNIVNKIAASNYFQKATELKYIKSAMENVSNCQLLLNVELKRLNGTLALNIPPHPSDRLWYGFVNKPNIILTATPQVGEKEVSYSAISDFIADKLKMEFQKVLVFPNMDDFYIPILNSEVNYQNW